MAADVLESLARLQEKFGGTPYEMLVDDLVAALAADKTAADLRQEVEFLKAEVAELKDQMAGMIPIEQA